MLTEDDAATADTYDSDADAAAFGGDELCVTEIPSVSPRPLSGIHIPLSGAPV